MGSTALKYIGNMRAQFYLPHKTHINFNFQSLYRQGDHVDNVHNNIPPSSIRTGTRSTNSHMEVCVYLHNAHIVHSKLCESIKMVYGRGII